MYTIPAVIFSGGKSSRMKTDKALLPFGDFPTLSAYQHHKLSTLFESVYLSSKVDKFDFDCHIIEDRYPQSSPLVALVSVFETLPVKEVFVLSVDTPLVDASVIETLVEKKSLINADHSPVDAIVAKSPHGLQPLCAIYTRSIVKQAKENLSRDIHSLTKLLKASTIEVVSFPEETPFSNLNTPQEYEALTKSLFFR